MSGARKTSGLGALVEGTSSPERPAGGFLRSPYAAERSTGSMSPQQAPASPQVPRKNLVSLVTEVEFFYSTYSTSIQVELNVWFLAAESAESAPPGLRKEHEAWLRTLQGLASIFEPSEPRALAAGEPRNV